MAQFDIFTVLFYTGDVYIIQTSPNKYIYLYIFTFIDIHTEWTVYWYSLKHVHIGISFCLPIHPPRPPSNTAKIDTLKLQSNGFFGVGIIGVYSPGAPSKWQIDWTIVIRSDWDSGLSKIRGLSCPGQTLQGVDWAFCLQVLQLSSQSHLNEWELTQSFYDTETRRDALHPPKIKTSSIRCRT